MADEPTLLEIPKTFYLINKCNKLGINLKIDPVNLLPIIIHNVDVNIVNALRRIMISEINTLAFATDDITIIQNTSQYHREIVLDRMGFITIDLDYVKKAGIDITQIDSLIFTLDNKKTDEPLKNTSNVIMKVFVHDLRVTYKGQIVPVEKICPHDSLLLTLNPNESIHIHMKPSLGNGLMNARWCSSVTMYKFATHEDLKDNVEVVETNDEQQKYIGHESKNPKAIILTIESVGKMRSDNVIRQGLMVLREKMNSLRGELIQPSGKVIIENNQEIPNLSKFKIIDESHTLGNVMEYACLKMLIQLIRTVAPDQEMQMIGESICGYRKLHPLDTFIEVIIKLPSIVDRLPFPVETEHLPPHIRLMLLAINHVTEIIDNLATQFTKLTAV